MLRSDIFLSILQHNNAFCYYYLQDMAADLGDSDSRTVSLTQKHIRGRLAEALLFLKNNYGLEEDNATINIYLSREDMANLSNMTTSNTIRTLANFVSEHLIAMDGKKIKIIDEEKLLKISKLG
jgi:CRP-like cAMP-binding protein